MSTAICPKCNKSFTTVGLKRHQNKCNQLVIPSIPEPKRPEEVKVPKVPLPLGTEEPIDNAKFVQFMDKLLMVSYNVSFVPSVFTEIFELDEDDDYGQKHYYDRFCNTDGNLLQFYQYLDKDNRRLFVDWVIRINTSDY